MKESVSFVLNGKKYVFRRNGKHVFKIGEELIRCSEVTDANS